MTYRSIIAIYKYLNIAGDLKEVVGAVYINKTGGRGSVNELSIKFGAIFLFQLTIY
jgi:hypothetical protein